MALNDFFIGGFSDRYSQPRFIYSVYIIVEKKRVRVERGRDNRFLRRML